MLARRGLKIAGVCAVIAVILGGLGGELEVGLMIRAGNAGLALAAAVLAARAVARPHASDAWLFAQVILWGGVAAGLGYLAYAPGPTVAIWEVIGAIIDALG